MDSTLQQRAVSGLRGLLVVVLAISNLFYIITSIHWPIIWDSAVMHYVNFLMDHGMKPYQDITDSNMPGAYITEGWAMHLFGAGDVAWRIYDFFLLAVLTIAMVFITRPYHWLAGVYAGGMFALLHGSEGPDFAVEREQVMTTLVVVAFALLFEALRRSRPAYMLFFGLALGMAGSIKPTSAPLGPLLLLFAVFVLRRRLIASTPYVLWALAGFALASAIFLAFLFRHHAFHDFLFVTRTLLPSYVSLKHLGWADLLRIMFPRNLLLLLPLAVALALADRSWTFERWILLLGMAFGAFSFFAQRKGFIYHRYPFVVFLLLLMGLQFVTALALPGWKRVLGSLGILSTLFISVPHYILTIRISTLASPIALSRALVRDLESLDPSSSEGHPSSSEGHLSSLQGKVQCFDLTYGCFSALYHLRLVENTGFTGDLLFFSPTPGPAVDYYRSMFWRLAQKDPATVLVLTNEWFQGKDSFNKLNTWPEFARYLAANYTEVRSGSFPLPTVVYRPGEADPPSYRIYVRNGTALLARALPANTSAMRP